MNHYLELFLGFQATGHSLKHKDLQGLKENDMPGLKRMGVGGP